MTFQEFMVKMTDAFPKATVSEDDDGQLIVETGLYIEADDTKSAGDQEVVESDPDPQSCIYRAIE